MNWLSILTTIWENRWDVFLLIGMIMYRKQLFVAFAGGNGKLQADEIAKGIVLLVFYLSFEAEATRKDLANHIFPESYWYALIGGVFLIAGLKLAEVYRKQHGGGAEETKKEEA